MWTRERATSLLWTRYHTSVRLQTVAHNKIPLPDLRRPHNQYAPPSRQLRGAQPSASQSKLRRRINQSVAQISLAPYTTSTVPPCFATHASPRTNKERERGEEFTRPMPTSVATHASLLLKAAAAAAAAAAAPAHLHLHPKPFFSPRAAASAVRIPPPRADLGCRRLPTTTATTTVASGRWFWWTTPVASVRGLCAAPHSGIEEMGSDGAEARRRRVAPAVNGLSKEDRPSPAPPRLLTLPTVLTIGRVAAVPLLISSKCDKT
jgi:hypothetical protein